MGLSESESTVDQESREFGDWRKNQVGGDKTINGVIISECPQFVVAGDCVFQNPHVELSLLLIAYKFIFS